MRIQQAGRCGVGLAGRSGGACAGAMAGMPMTMTDLGLWKEGGVLRRRLRLSGLWELGAAMAGMYWYCAVWTLVEDAGEVNDGADVGRVGAGAG